MREVILEGNKMLTKEQTHQYIAQMLDFPSYYGNNLDALYDLLSMLTEETKIVLKGKEKMENNLGEYGGVLLHVFQDAKSSNTSLSLEILL